MPRARLEELMREVGLGARVPLLDEAEGARGLSVGEQQRLALLRLILAEPRWAFLDEATSALDVASEEALHRLLRERLAQTSFILIAHRAPRGFEGLEKVDLERAAPTD